MGLSSQYRESAAECVRAAQAAKSPGNKALYLTMAEEWVRLADHAESVPGRPSARIRQIHNRRTAPRQSIDLMSQSKLRHEEVSCIGGKRPPNGGSLHQTTIGTWLRKA